jgi:hypothetical protein
MEVRVMKVFRFVVVLVALAAFALTGVAVAGGMYYVVKDKMGTVKVVDQKPQDPGMVVKGPFKSKDEAKKALDATKKPVK